MVICSLFTRFMFRKREHAPFVTSLLEEVQERGTIFLTPFQPGRPLGRQHLEQAHSQVIKGGNMSGKFLIMPNHQIIKFSWQWEFTKANLWRKIFQIKHWKVIIMSSVASCSKDLKISILHRYFNVTSAWTFPLKQRSFWYGWLKSADLSTSRKPKPWDLKNWLEKTLRFRPQTLSISTSGRHVQIFVF